MHTPQEIYAARCKLEQLADADRAAGARELGGVFTAGSDEPFDFYEATLCTLELLGITARGQNEAKAVASWLIIAGLRSPSANAHDGRPSCPYSGQRPVGEIAGA